MSLKIKDKFVVFGLLMIILTTIILSTINYMNSYKMLKKSFEDKSFSVMDSVSFSLNKFMKEIENVLYMVDRSEHVKTNPSEEDKIRFNRYIEDILLTHRNILNIYYGTNTGNVILAPSRTLPEDYDPRERHWYKEAVSKNKIIWTDPYTDAATGNLVITAAKPLYSKGEFIGAIGIDIDIEEVKEHLSNIKLSNTGYFVIVNEQNSIILHPEQDLVGKSLPAEELAKGLKLGDRGRIQYKWLGIQKYAVYTTIEINRWKIIGVAQAQEFLKDTNRILMYTILAGMFVVFLSVLLGRIITNKITNDLNSLVTHIEKIEQGDMRVRSAIKGKDEAGVISRHLNKMLEKLNLLMDSTSDVIWEYDVDNDRVIVVTQHIDIEAYEKNSYSSIKHFLEFIHPEDRNLAIRDYFDFIKGRTNMFISEFRLRKRDGSYFWVNVRGKVIERKNGKIAKIAGSITNITEKKEYENKIYKMAYYDSLTGLPNRELFREELKAAIQDPKVASAAIILIDLDDFKKINDTLGHGIGDKFLKAVVLNLERFKHDSIFLSRVGGDEFLILYKNPRGEEDALELGNSIRETLNFPINVENNTLINTISVGVSLYPCHGQNEDTLISNADIAMYSAKASGKNKVQLFNESMHNSFNRKVEVENALKKADYEEEMEVYYQPQINIKTGKVRGFEALIRWNSKKLGSVSPVEFITIAEQCGEIKHIGRWVINKAFKQTKLFLQKGYEFERVSINISTVQLLDENFISYIEEALKNSEISSKYIEFEITESVLISNKKDSIEILNKLRALGFKIALDDFGTGYSSLSYLKILPVDLLKIDKSFIDTLTTDSRSKALIQAVIKLSHDLGMEVVAEGVEDLEQLEILKDFSCDIIQGYYFSKPLPYEEVRSIYDNIKVKEI